MSWIIGGEFEIDPVSLKNQMKWDDSNGLYYGSGRVALYYILENIRQQSSRIDTILLPDYLCESIIETVNLKGYKIKYYELTDQLTIKREQFSKLYSGKEAVLLINYFGLVNTEEQAEYIRTLDPCSCIILDNVQAFYEMGNQTKANYSFTSFRKWFPTPDGALVKTKEPGISLPKGENKFAEYKIAASILKNCRNENVNLDDIYLDIFNKGEQLISTNMDAQMSDASKLIFSNLDFDSTAIRRIENAKFIINELKELGINPLLNLEENRVPLFIPIKLHARDLIRIKLAKKGIFCPVHWPVMIPDQLLKGKEMFEKELSIVIDQRYNIQDMSQIIIIIKQCLVA